MYMLKDLKIVKRKGPLQSFEDLYCGEIKIGHTTTNIFKIETTSEHQSYPTVKPFMFKFDIGLQSNVMPIIYGYSIDDCRNAAIEQFRDFINSFLR